MAERFASPLFYGNEYAMARSKNKWPLILAARDHAVGGPFVRFVVMAVLLIGASGCLSNFGGLRTDYAQVTSLEVEQEVTTKSPAPMHQAQLREEIERFAYRYAAHLVPLLDSIEDELTTPEQRLKVHKWKSRFVYSLAEIAHGSDPEVNLLDMVVLTALVRMVSERRLVPEVFSGDKGQEWLVAVRQSEREIWLVAEKVLDPEQQTTLRELIRDWQTNNPEVDNVTTVRFSNFASELGADKLDSLVQPGGFLPEVSEATRAVDEIRRTTERMMFLAFLTPRLARLESESLLYDLATQPEFKEHRTSLRNFSEAAVKLAGVSDKLPGLIAAERHAAVDQAIDRLIDEQENFFDEIDKRETSFKDLLIQIQDTLNVGERLTSNVTETMLTVESLVTRLELDKPSLEKEGFRIENYRDMLTEAKVAAIEINKVVQSLERFSNADLDEQGTPPVAGALNELERRIERLIWLEFLALASLVLFTAIVVVGALLAYRRFLPRLTSTR